MGVETSQKAWWVTEAAPFGSEKRYWSKYLSFIKVFIEGDGGSPSQGPLEAFLPEETTGAAAAVPLQGDTENERRVQSLVDSLCVN